MSDDFSLHAVPIQCSPWEQFTQFLQSRGKRVTRQRQQIVEHVFSHHDHFDVEELMDHLRDLIAQGEVSRPTVYRTLGELVEAGLLKKMTLGDRSIYEHEYGYPSHDHLYCQVCNRLIEFHSEALEQLRDTVARQHCFTVLGHRMFITGICAECRRRQKQKEKHE